MIVHHGPRSAQRSRGDSRIQPQPDAIWKLVREDPDDEFLPDFSAAGRDVEVQRVVGDGTTRRTVVLTKYFAANRQMPESSVEPSRSGG